MEFIFDTHTHSTISDGGNTPEEMLESAAAKGLKVFALTDHFDIHDRFPEPLSRFDGAGRESSYRLLSELKQRNSEAGVSPVKFLNGIEIGQAHHFKETAENWLDSHSYDFVLASCHIIRGHIDFYHMDYLKNPPDALLKQYFTELIELCSWSGTNKKFDSLAHLTYPLRYMGGRGDLNKHRTAIDELFVLMVKYEIALEINTQNSTICPDFPEVKRYRELRGRLLTIGSDSHNVDTVGAGIEKGVEIATAAGFTECVYYEQRKPYFMKL